jgi:hypothetical protein
MPVTDTLPDPWYETPNIHHCTIRDFVGLCRLDTIAWRPMRRRCSSTALGWRVAWIVCDRIT